ncbi:hypothetical protein NicSoilB4_07190 [Arthrobacter sp. NicSoilB4]|uniref:hypothetical protein n=1 Tax=Arthrobacter sp. NicSoilB4 TaxID=2830997 RepID=UPI001CC65767|nr:hypothetical protein [Arthrobacter sp. NicSoilB4]BCW65956.1 hypothetical protein NicSoilB4_07190 [Arthrobacter sp. NicSoilB4]
MKKVLAAAGIAGLALLATSAPAFAGPDDKITICHATGSDSHPYNEITISENGLNGHNAQGVHDDDIVPAPAGGCPGGDNGNNDDDDNGSDSKKVTICHATGSEENPYNVITISEKAWLNGHKDGHNGNADIYPVPAKGCHEADDDDEEENPGGGGGTTEPPTVVPPAVVPPAVVPPAAVPPGAGAAAVVPSGAGAAVAVNRGFNAQTAVSNSSDAGLPGWAAGLAALLAAGSVVALRRRGRGQGADAAI